MNVGEMTVIQMDEKERMLAKWLSEPNGWTWTRNKAREGRPGDERVRERERERERASPRENGDSRRRTNPSAWLRRRARRVAEGGAKDVAAVAASAGGDAATAAVVVPLSMGVKEATNVEGEDDDDEEEEG